MQQLPIYYYQQLITYDITYDAPCQLLNADSQTIHSFIPMVYQLSKYGNQFAKSLKCCTGLIFVGKLIRFIMFKMRKTTYFSLIKDSLFELVKGSTSTTDCSKEQAKQSKNNFYLQFLQDSSSLHCKITTVEVVPRSGFESSYAVYCIEVKNDMVEYEIKKRYTQFQKLYIRCSRLQKLASSFPTKTIFQSGWSEQVTNERLQKLNKILNQINCQTSSDQQKRQLFQFIELYDKYQQNKVQMKTTQIQNLVTDEFLLLEMVKLNENSKSMLDSFERIKNSLSQRKKRIGYDIAKQILTGFQTYDGLLSIVMNSQNQLVIMLGLKLINWLISPEMNRDYQIFRKILTKCIPNNFVLQKFEQLRQHCEISLEYFKLLSLYFSIRQDLQIKNIAKFYDEGESIEKQYMRWAKYNSFY